MLLVGVKYWICDWLHSTCGTPPQYTILKPFYHTVCFCHKILCNDNEHISKNNIYDDNLPKLKYSGIISKCNVTHYVSHIMGRICTLSCNISDSKIQIKSPPNDHSCRVSDCLTSAKVLTQVSCTALNNEGKCYMYWCYIQDYTKFWAMKFQQQWLDLVEYAFPQQFQLPPVPETNLVKKVDSSWEKWIRNWISHNLGIQWPRNVSLFHYCTAATMLLFVLLIFRKCLKHKKDSTAPNLEDSEEKFLRAIIDVLSKNNYEPLKQLLLEQNNLKHDEIIQDLNKQIRAFEIEITEHATKQIDIDNKFQQKCEEYESQIQNLIEQLSNLQKDHSIQNQKYLSANEKICELDKVVEALKTVSQFHQYQETIPHEARVQQPGAGISPKRDDQCYATAEQEDPDVIEAFKTIAAVLKDTQELIKQIEVFSGNEEDKIFLHLNELLIRNTLKLDNIESKGLFDIRNKRKETLHYIQHCKRILRSKVVS